MEMATAAVGFTMLTMMTKTAVMLLWKGHTPYEL